MVSSHVLGCVGETEALCSAHTGYVAPTMWHWFRFELFCLAVLLHHALFQSKEQVDAPNLILVEICPFYPNQKRNRLKGN